MADSPRVTWSQARDDSPLRLASRVTHPRYASKSVLDSDPDIDEMRNYKELLEIASNLVPGKLGIGALGMMVGRKTMIDPQLLRRTPVEDLSGFDLIASTYPAQTDAVVVPVYTKIPDVKLNAKGESWDDFWNISKDYREALKDPNIRILEIDDIVDVGPKWAKMFPNVEKTSDMVSRLRFVKKHPTEDLPVISTIDKSSFPYKTGGLVQVLKSSK